MVYSASVYRILIASPSDVPKERKNVYEIIHTWNEENSLEEKTVLFPVIWESRSTPDKGVSNRDVINEKLVDNCDILIGIFWTRIDSDAGGVKSGSLEEMERFIETGKPFMLLFSSRPIVPDSIDPEQYGKLRDFREKHKHGGLVYQYSSIEELLELVNINLSATIRNIQPDNLPRKGEQEPEEVKDESKPQGEVKGGDAKSGEREKKPKRVTEDPKVKDRDTKSGDTNSEPKRKVEPAKEDAKVKARDIEPGDTKGEPEKKVELVKEDLSVKAEDVELEETKEEPEKKVELGNMDVTSNADDVAQVVQPEKTKEKAAISDGQKASKEIDEEKREVKLPGKKTDRIASEKLLNIRKKVKSEISRLEIEWIGERDSDPGEIQVGKSILEKVGQKLKDLEIQMQIEMDKEEVAPLTEIIEDTKNIQKHRLLPDGGKSYDAFWKKGNDIFQRYQKVINMI